MNIAIVILNWNGADLLNKFIPKLIEFSQNDNVELIVADNASTDDSLTLLKEKFPEITTISNESNFGFAKGYNEALKKVNADIFCLLNSDVEVSENWLTPILSIFEKEKNTAIIQPKILDFKNKLYFEYAGAAGGFLDKYGYPFCRGRIFNSLEKDENQFNDNKPIFWASGACFFIRSKVFFELNGFDEDYFAHQEEIDLCWRAQNLGYNIKYTGLSTVYHVGGATLKETNPKKTYLNFRNSLFSLIKNLPKNIIFRIVFVRLFLDGIAGIHFFLTGKPKHTLAILKAHVSFYKNLRKMYHKRSVKEFKSNFFYTKSIVFSYFLKNKKKFNEL
ncbi:MAG: glycosyltransferase family 2 protein [Lutibacter sp.]